MPKCVEFKAKGYLEKSYLDKDGAKHTTFEWSVKDALAIAKLELMSRDLRTHLPVLIEVTARVSLSKGYKDAKRKKQTQTIR